MLSSIKQFDDAELYQVNNQYFLVVTGYATGADMGEHNVYNSEAIVYRWTGDKNTAPDDLPPAYHENWQAVAGFDYGDDWDSYAQQVEEIITDNLIIG